MRKATVLAVFGVMFVGLITYNFVHVDTSSLVREENASIFKMFSPNIVSICIPAIASDMTIGLPRLLKSIEKQTHIPHEVIIVMSNVSSSNCKQFDEHLKSIIKCSTLRLYCILKLQYQSVSRQNAAALARGTIISFIDADDFMYPNRIEVIVQLFAKYRPFMVLHGFSKNIEPPPNNKWKGASIMNGIELYDIANTTLSRQLHLSDDIMHSQMSVLRYVCKLISFRTEKQFYRTEDAWYIRDIISFFGRVNNTAVFINTPLAWHLPREFQIG